MRLLRRSSQVVGMVELETDEVVRQTFICPGEGKGFFLYLSVPLLC